jgi:cell division septum initiation protein DivIVA
MFVIPNKRYTIVNNGVLLTFEFNNKLFNFKVPIGCKAIVTYLINNEAEQIFGKINSIGLISGTGNERLIIKVNNSPISFSSIIAIDVIEMNSISAEDVDVTEDTPIITLKDLQLSDINDYYKALNADDAFNEIGYKLKNFMASNYPDEDRNKVALINTSGDGTNFLADNGLYKTVQVDSPIDDLNDASTNTTLSASEIVTRLNNIVSQLKSYTDTKASNIVNSAPELLDTLSELSNALGNDANFATNVLNEISTKVDKIIGKDLSTNDYTTEEKSKVSIINNIGDGTKFLADNGLYKVISVINDQVASLNTTYSSTIIDEKLNNKSNIDHTHATYEEAVSKAHDHSNKVVLDGIINTGTGSQFLSDDGTYKIVSGSGDTGTGGANIDDATTSLTTTYSSQKIEDKLATKSNTDHSDSEYVHSNQTVLDSISNSGGVAVDLSEIKTQIQDIDLRSTVGSELDYGYFTMSTTQVAVANGIIKFDTATKAKNISGTADGYINLKKGITYNISCDISINKTSGYVFYYIYENITNTAISSIGTCISASYTSNESPRSIDFIYTATEDCSIYAKISLQGGSATINGSGGSYLKVEEIGRTFLVDPMYVKDTHILEYGEFRLSASQILTTAANVLVNFDTIAESNDIPLNNNCVILKANRSYRLSCSIFATTVIGYINFCFYNMTDNIQIGTTNYSASTSYSASLSGDNNIETIYTPTKDTQIGVKVLSVTANGINIAFASSYLIVQEIGQPVVVEYNKETYNEISNPLIVEPLEKCQIDAFTTGYGYSSVTANVHLNFSTANIQYSNMEILNGGIKLKANKLYSIAFNTAFGTNASSSGTYTISLCDTNNNKIQDLCAMTPATNTSSPYRSTSNSGEMLYQPTEDIYISICTNVTLTSLTFYFIVREIRDMPVNQYGGFENATLFEGNINAVGNYTLADSIDNYDFLIIKLDSSNGDYGHHFILNKPILNKSYCLNIFASTNYNIWADYKFDISTRIIIQSFVVVGFSNMRIWQIIGVKGQLPTLISGGEF